MGKIFGIDGVIDYYRRWLRVGRYWYGVNRHRLTRIPVIQGGTSANTTQEDFWFRNDDGSLTTATYIGSQNSNYSPTGITEDLTFRIRIIAEENNGKNDPWAFQLGAQKNGTGGYTLITAARTDGIQYADDGNSIADGTTIATGDFDLTYTGTPVAGEYDDAGSPGTGTISLNGQYTEIEFCLKIVFNQINSGDYFDLQLLDTGGGALDGYNTTPRITVTKGATTHQASATLGGVGSIVAAGNIVGTLFVVDFEENDLSDFDSTTDGGGNLAVGTAGAMVGTYGLTVTYDSSNAARGTMTTSCQFPWSSNKINTRFYLNVDSLFMGSGDDFVLMTIGADGSLSGITNIGYLRLTESSGNIQVRLMAKDDSDVSNYTTQVNVPSGDCYIECRYVRATSFISNDGICALYINGTQQPGTISNLDNFNLWPTADDMAIGAVSLLDVTTFGTFKIDDWILTNDGNLIGGAATAITGAATLSGSASTTGTGVVTRAGASLLSGSATIDAIPTVVTTHTASAALSGAGSLTASGTYIHKASSTLSGVGLLTAIPFTGSTINSGANLSAVGGVASASSVTYAGQTALSGIATITATATIGPPPITGAATLSATATTIGVGAITYAGTSSLTGTGTVVAVGAIVGAINSGAILSGVGGVTAFAGVTRSTSATLTGAATLAGAGSFVRYAQTIIAGVSSMSGSASVLRGGNAQLSGSATVTANGARIFTGAAFVSGSAQIVASGSILGTVLAAASLSSVANITGIASIIRSAQSTLAGAGTLTGTAQNIKNGSVVLSGVGAISPVASIDYAAVATLAAIALLTATGRFHFDVLYPNPDKLIFVEFRDKRTFVDHREKRERVIFKNKRTEV